LDDRFGALWTCPDRSPRETARNRPDRKRFSARSGSADSAAYGAHPFRRSGWDAPTCSRAWRRSSAAVSAPVAGGANVVPRCVCTLASVRRFSRGAPARPPATCVRLCGASGRRGSCGLDRAPGQEQGLGDLAVSLALAGQARDPQLRRGRGAESTAELIALARQIRNRVSQAFGITLPPRADAGRRRSVGDVIRNVEAISPPRPDEPGGGARAHASNPPRACG
jgi:hypothetical protein